MLNKDGSITNQYRNFIALSRYARWLPDENRRETWSETVERYMQYWNDKYPGLLDGISDYGEEYYISIRDAILNHEVMPSMRCLMTAGPALEKDNVAGFNCSYVAASGSGEGIEVLTPEMEDLGLPPITVSISHPHAFDEIVYILMCGTGVGFSVERQEIATLPVVGNKLPRKYYARTEENYPGVPKDELSTFSRRTNTIYAADSKYGWASAFRILLNELYNGNFDVEWDLSAIRPAGEKLKTFGGRASGPEPLNDLFKYAVNLFRTATARKLNSIEVHGLVCKIAEVVVVGGVRRSALISLSNLSDDRMRHAKSGQWWDEHSEFRLANNSVAYQEIPNSITFLREWISLVESKSGERGIFSRVASQAQAGKNGRRDNSYSFGTNPCSEIILRDKQFCNLSEVVVRAGDTLRDLKRKVRIAAILGTLQATLTDFKYLRPEWKKNTEEEALLGVSLTGIMDHPVLSGIADKILSESFTDPEDFGLEGDEGLVDWLQELKGVAIETNKEWAAKLGINQSAAITCVKPSGTVSQLVDSASGIHPRYSPYYVRTVRADKKDPLAQMMVDKGFPVEDDVTKPDSTYVFSFPVKSPEGSVFRDDKTAIEQLELWLTYQRHWCEHKPSVTIYVKENEWLEVGAWVYEHFDEVSGVSFLPHTDHVYKQPPYQEITEEEYYTLMKSMPADIDWTELSNYEFDDMTEGVQEFACTGGACEIL